LGASVNSSTPVGQVVNRSLNTELSHTYTSQPVPCTPMHRTNGRPPQTEEVPVYGHGQGREYEHDPARGAFLNDLQLEEKP